MFSHVNISYIFTNQRDARRVHRITDCLSMKNALDLSNVSKTHISNKLGFEKYHSEL